MIRLLDNPVQHYAWGSPDSIPALLGRAPDGRPWAELWMGAHRSAPSRIAGEPLDRLIAASPIDLLGERVAGGFGGRLPFLFKVLAAARPLSIQCHPDPDQARAGFERENRLGIPIDDRRRNYRDDSHKPELIAALGRFEALVGFREVAEIRERLARIAPRSLQRELPLLDRGLEPFFTGLMRHRDLGAVVAEAVSGLAGDDSREAYWVTRLAADFPADAGALAPIYLHHIELEPDQALFLGPGVLHSYLGGTGLEIMASSDNVLRGGLTDKHVDTGELCAVLRFEPFAPARLAPVTTDGRHFELPALAPEFRLAFVLLGPEVHQRIASGPEIALCLGDRCRLADADSSIELRRGQSAFISPGPIRAEGEGRLYLASVP